MQSIVLKNFKSYEYQSLTDLHSRINIVIGANGQGKSNFLKAISFLFTDKFTINKAEFNSTLYRGAKQQNPELSVQAVFHQNRDQSKDGYKISKSWSNYNHEELRVNNKSRSKGQYENFIESFGLSYSNPYNIVQQGKISQIALMNQTELYLLLEQTAGVKKFMKKHEQAQHNLSKIENQLLQVQDELKSLKQKMAHVQSRKLQFEYYSNQQKVRKIKRKRHLKNNLQNVRKTINDMKQHHMQVLKQLQLTKTIQRNLQQQIEQNRRQIQALIGKQVFYQTEQTQQIRQISNNTSRNDIKKSLTQKRKQLKDLEKQINTSQKMLEQSQMKLNEIQKQLNAYKQKYDMIKLDFQSQGENKDAKKIKDAYENKVKLEKQNIKGYQQQIKKVQAIKSEFKLVPYAKEQNQLKKIKQQQEKIEQERVKNKTSQIQLGRNKNDIQLKLQSLQSRRKSINQIVKKILPLIDFRLLSILQDQKIKGVYGYLLQHLKIEKELSYAYEVSGLSKLCTLIVQDDDVAAQVVEINSKIKGKTINILPLSYIRTQILQRRTYPQMDNVCNLINQDWIRIVQSRELSEQTKTDFKKIIQNTFCKYALVQDYNLALKVSKQYNLHCITPDKEVVYADAIMCKVGRQASYDKGKIQQFQQLQELTNTVNKKKNQLKILEQKQVQLQNSEISIINQKQAINRRVKDLQKIVNQGKKIQTTIQKIQETKNNLNKSIQRSKNTINQYQKALLNLKNNIKSKFKQQDLKKAESDYFSFKNRAQQIFTQNYKHQKNLSILLRQSQTLKKEIFNLQKINPNVIQLASNDQILKQVIQKQKKLQKQIFLSQKNLNKLAQKRQNHRMKQAGLLAQINAQQENIKDIIQQIENLQDANQQQQDEIQQISHSLSLKINLNPQNRKHIYSAGDKLFFAKLEQYLQKVRYFEESTNKIRRQKSKLLEYIKLTEQQAKSHMKQFISNFEKYFIAYFLRIVPNGKADLRTKVYTQKVKGLTKNGFSVEIKVSFNEQEGIRRWGEFSGGQKTVLALCIILAIQKCQPTPFCVLDQVDAALDANFADKIVDIIIQESQFCQYFITSFKKTLLQFPEQISSFYEVRSANRISQIVKVQKSDVEELVQRLAH